jgi:hypothetical protein
MKSLIHTVPILFLCISLSYCGFFDDLVSDVKSAGETIGSGAANAYNWTKEEAIPAVGKTLVETGETIETGAVKAYNWTREVRLCRKQTILCVTHEKNCQNFMKAIEKFIVFPGCYPNRY